MSISCQNRPLLRDFGRKYGISLNSIRSLFGFKPIYPKHLTCNQTSILVVRVSSLRERFFYLLCGVVDSTGWP